MGIKVDNGQDTVDIGDFVGFKDDLEDSGKLVRIEGRTLIVSVYDCDTGDRYERHVDANRAWKEG